MFIQTPEEFEAAQTQLFEYMNSDNKDPGDASRFEHLILYMEAYTVATTGLPSALSIMASQTKDMSDEERKKVVTRFITTVLRND